MDCLGKTCGWRISLEDLYLESVAYASMRTLRLVRRRQAASGSEDAKTAFDFAKLPVEINDMILREVRIVSIAHSRRSEPFLSPFCDCMLAENVFRDPAALQPFNQWCLQTVGQIVDHPLDDKDMVISRLRRSFQASDACVPVLDEIRQKLAELEGYCIRCEQDWVNTWVTITNVEDGVKRNDMVSCSSQRLKS
jgi:hypothetical protein